MKKRKSKRRLKLGVAVLVLALLATVCTIPLLGSLTLFDCTRTLWLFKYPRCVTIWDGNGKRGVLITDKKELRDLRRSAAHYHSLADPMANSERIAIVGYPLFAVENLSGHTEYVDFPAHVHADGTVVWSFAPPEPHQMKKQPHYRDVVLDLAAKHGLELRQECQPVDALDGDSAALHLRK